MTFLTNAESLHKEIAELRNEQAAVRGVLADHGLHMQRIEEKIDTLIAAASTRNGHPPEGIEEIIQRAAAAVKEKVPLVLVLEDDPAVARALERLLDRTCHIKMTRTVREAMIVVETLGARLDLVLLDIQVPDGNGLTVCQAIRRIAGGKVIEIGIMSAHADDARRDAALRAGADWFHHKADVVDHVRDRLAARHESTEG